MSAPKSIVVGDRVWVDGVPCLIEGLCRYVGGHPNRKEGVTVRPYLGGRAKVVAVTRLGSPDSLHAPPWPRLPDRFDASATDNVSLSPASAPEILGSLPGRDKP